MEHNTEHNDMHDVKWGFGLDSDPQKRLLFSSSTEFAPKEEGPQPDGGRRQQPGECQETLK